MDVVRVAQCILLLLPNPSLWTSLLAEWCSTGGWVLAYLATMELSAYWIRLSGQLSLPYLCVAPVYLQGGLSVYRVLMSGSVLAWSAVLTAWPEGHMTV